jgi:hypothetical protein
VLLEILDTADHKVGRVNGLQERKEGDEIPERPSRVWAIGNASVLP